MSDLSPQFDSILNKHNASINAHRWQIDSIADEFLKEAYRIDEHIRSLRRYLLSIRRAYLSAAPPPRRHQRGSQAKPNVADGDLTYLADSDKDSVDANSKSLLRDLAASLTQLASAESLRRETSARILASKYHRGFLGTWAAGTGAAAKSAEQLLEEGKLESLRLVRESVIWYLQKNLEDVGEIQRKMMERRLERQIEKGRSVLYNAQGPKILAQAGLNNGFVPDDEVAPFMQTAQAKAEAWKLEEESRKEAEQRLSPEQLQLFDRENQDMLKHYEDQLDQVRTAERSMYEISELQTQLVQNVDIQSANISQLVTESMSTTENVGGGNKELKRATERASKARVVFLATCGLCSFLVVWDLIF